MKKIEGHLIHAATSARVPFKISAIHLSLKNLSSCQLEFAGKNCRQIYGKSKASVWRNLSKVTAPKICQ